ncbi:hypothetical protein I2F17_09610, partial [Acinetobacter sp. B10A]|uniref:ESPR-type extended signal peptide-containing protein n=1 Tax=Acinetobacter baretiae TaxID=2605383 RepID=UPI0022A7E762
MNKVYKVIWNAALGTWCAVSELGKSKKKSTRTVVSAAGSLVLITLSQASFAGFTAGGGTYCTGAGNNPYGAVAIGGNSDAPCAVGAATAIGNAARATADSSTAIGSGAIATARGATSIGNDAQASAAGALAVTTGDGSGSSKGNASGVNSIIIGTSVNASQQEAIAIGAYSSAGVAGGVALGSYSTTTTPAGTVGYDPLTGTTSTQTSTTWRSNKGAVSVGNGTTTTRQITGVAAGSADTDVTNVAQLKQAQTYSTNTANSLRNLVGGNATVASNGTVSTSDIGGTGKANVSDAVASVKASTATAQSAADTAQATANKGLNFRANTGAADKVSLGETVTLADGTNTTATYDASNNIYKYSVVDAPIFAGQVTAKGLNASNAKVTGVAAGTIDGSSTDAVNGSQIKSISDSTASLLGGNATVASDGTVMTSNIGGTGKANVSDAVASVKASTATAQATADKGLNFRANSEAADKVSLGETVTFANGTNTTATYDASSNTYKYSVVDAPIFAGQVTAKGLNASNEKVTGVASGTINSSSTDAVNGSQIKSISDSTASLLGGNATVAENGTVSTSDIGGTGKANV